MFDKYYLRKKEIIENVLMIVICDVERDGITMEQARSISKDQDPKIKENMINNNSTFNTADVDILFQDFQSNFQEIENVVNVIQNEIHNMPI